MVCGCGTTAEFLQFQTFSYYYCRECKKEVELKPELDVNEMFETATNQYNENLQQIGPLTQEQVDHLLSVGPDYLR